MVRPTLAALLLFAASVPAQAPKPSSAPGAPAAVTFAEHVAPIVLARCAACHRPGEAAPFSLLTYADVRKRGRMVAYVARKRIMPPWHPVEGHGEFVGAMRMGDDEIATLVRWVETGMAEGDAAKLPAVPELEDGWRLGKPDLVVTMPQGYEVPASGPDIYRNFVIPLALDEDRWLTAIDVRPSARSVLHHIIFNLDRNGRAREYDGEDGQPGYDGMSGGRGRGLRRVGTSTSGLGGWAVGGMPRRLPMGLARKVPKGSDLILQSHFHPSGKKETERTTLGLYFTDEPPARTMLGLQLPPGFGIAAGLDIPPGEKCFKLEDSFTLPVAALAVTVGGHAHYVCRQMQVFATKPEGEKQSIFWIDDWAFNWQNRYQYKQPLELPAGTRIDVCLTYDNSEDNPANPHDPPRRIRWGLQSTDEMGSVTLLLVARDESDTRTLKRAIRKHSRSRLRRSPAALSGMLVSRIKMLDKNGNGEIEKHEIPERLRALAARFDANDDGKIDAAEVEEIEDRIADFAGRRRERK